ncbi:MAG: hypothetical protein IT378_21975 [Sandaracinaceae bacterium]|nr:hypothetical protein [Sandaracinaceae bacterium]
MPKLLVWAWMLAACAAPSPPRCLATTRVLEQGEPTALGSAGELAARARLDARAPLTYAGLGDVELAATLTAQHILLSEPLDPACPAALAASVRASFATSDDVFDVAWDESPAIDVERSELSVERVVYLGELGPRWRPPPPATQVIAGLRAALESDGARLVEAWVDVPDDRTGARARAASYAAPE